MLGSLFKTKTNDPQYFVTLKINKHKVSAAIFSLAAESAKVTGTASRKHLGDWESITEAVDACVSQAASDIPLEKITKVIFAFPPTYLSEDKIHKDILPHLKKLTSELELTPSGFIVIPEALSYYYQQELGSQSALFIGIEPTELYLSLVVGGKLTHKVIPFSKSLSQTLNSSFSHFSENEIFPSTIVLYDGENLDKAKEELLDFPWQNNPKFLHIPKIEIISDTVSTEAIVMAVASELTHTFVSPNSSSNNVEEENNVENSHHSADSSDLTQQAISKVNKESLGFSNYQVSHDQPPSTFIPKVPFVKIPNIPFISHKSISVRPEFHNESPIQQQKMLAEDQDNSKLKLPRNSKKLLLPLAGVVAVIMVLFGAYFFASYSLPKAKLTLIIDPKTYSEEKEITVDPDIVAASSSNNSVPGKVLSSVVTGEKTLPTTGKKLIGDPSKGKITLYNKSAEQRLFAKGTKISSSNIVFITQVDAEVPKASESVDGLTYGKAQVDVVAEKIGNQGNLPAGTEFTIEDFSNVSYSARNEEALSGGTSREVAAVAKKDVEMLGSQLKDELITQAKEDLKTKLVGSEKLLEDSIEGEVSNEKYTPDADAEGKEVSASLTLSVQALVYREEDFTSIMESIVRANIPQGYEFNSQNSTVEVNKKSKEDNNLFTAVINAQLFPTLDLGKIKKEISGMPTNKIEPYIKSLTNVAGYEIVFKTPFSLFDTKLPQLSQNIEIEVKSR